jgi:hypothetical protein
MVCVHPPPSPQLQTTRHFALSKYFEPLSELTHCTPSVTGRLKTKAERTRLVIERDDRSDDEKLAQSQLQQVGTECCMLYALGPAPRSKDVK